MYISVTMMISRVTWVNSSHPYLENDPSSSLVSHCLRISPWLRYSYKQIQKYLKDITPGVEGVECITIGNLETLQFRQRVAGQKAPWRFPAINMSDGTLRALAVLTALLQGDGTTPSLIGIEEPEIALHPAAAGILWDAIQDGQDLTQVLVITHSPDLLDRKDIATDIILATDSEAGTTQIGPIIESSREAIRDRLSTPGELLRQERLRPETPRTASQSSMFSG